MNALKMENFILYPFAISGATLIVAFFALLYQIIATKAGVAGVPDLRQRRRFIVSFWLVTICLALCVGSAMLIFKPLLPIASAGDEHRNSIVVPPCPEDKGESATDIARNSPAKRDHPSTNGSKEFLINTMTYDHSPFAVMGTFSGVLTIGNKWVEISIPNPRFRVASFSRDGRTPRIITSVRVGIGLPSELDKIAAGRRGVVDWSETFPLNLEIDPGTEPISGPRINVKISKRVGAGTSNKAIIIEMKNMARDSHITLDTCYAVSKESVMLN